MKGMVFGKKFSNKIIIKGLKVYAYHGRLPEEKELGQFFLLDLVLHLDFLGNIHSDSLESTVNYVDVIEFVKKKFTEEKFNLIETVADYLCDVILENFPKIFRIDITLKKPTPPVDAEFEYIAIEVTRFKEGFSQILL